jgi:hypothetical protein
MIIKALIMATHALVRWGLCGTIAGIGRNITSRRITLIVHAIGAPGHLYDLDHPFGPDTWAVSVQK